MHPEMNIRLAQLRTDDMVRSAQQRHLPRTHRAGRRWRRRDVPRDMGPTMAAPAPLVHLRPPRPDGTDGVAGGGGRRAA